MTSDGLRNPIYWQYRMTERVHILSIILWYEIKEIYLDILTIKNGIIADKR